MAILIDKTHKLVEVITPKTDKVLIVFFHGIGDTVMAMPIFNKLEELYPNVKFDIGLCKGLEEEKIISNAVPLEGNWREECVKWDYDIVYCLNFNCENASDTTYTKAELACINEVGIEPVCGHVPLKTKPICGVCFNITSLPHLCNPDEETAKKIWQDIIDAGYVPVEIMMEHAFHNPVNQRFTFVDNSLRNWKTNLDTMMAMISKCDRLCSVVTGVFHLGMSILGKEKVMLLEKEIPAGCFTKDKIATANLKSYQNEVKTWLQNTYTL